MIGARKKKSLRFGYSVQRFRVEGFKVPRFRVLRLEDRRFKVEISC
jgi:hypothetical protein